MKVLYITKDVYRYRQGNYYADWLETFQKNSEVIIIDNIDNIDNEIDLEQFDLIIFGHSFIDMMMASLKIFNKRYLCKFGYLKMKELKFIIKNTLILNKLKITKIKKVYFSKNDYKLFEEKTFLANYLNIDLFITHTKSSLDIFTYRGIKVQLLWLPFSISKAKYFQTKDKKFDIGMRANSNKVYNNGERELLYNKVKDISKNKYNTDLHLSQNGECFLHGKNYIDWLSECHLLVNSVSANGTVGPKFLEAIACGTISLAFKNEYEGLLMADKHYLSIKPDLSNLETQIERFFNDKEFQNYLLLNAKLLLNEQCLENQYKKLIKGVI